jgi:hypothetical protein
MKINLLLNDASPRSQFLNIDPLAPPNDPLRVVGDFGDLNEHVDNAECDELIATDILDFLPASQIDDVLNHWVSKIRHGGTITVGGLDLREVSHGVVKHSLNIDDANLLIYGAQQAAWQHRRSATTLQNVLAVLTSKGLKPIKKRVESYFYSITMERP